MRDDKEAAALGTAPAEPVAWISEWAMQCLKGGTLTDAVLRPEKDKDFPHPLYASPAHATAAEIRADTSRMDWLEQHTVNVRQPLVYGSRDMFWASPQQDDGDVSPSDLRAQIDAARALSEATANGK